MRPMNMLWDELAGRAGLALDEAQRTKLARYIDLLLEANQRMNLTRIIDRQQAEVAHVGDALTLLPFLPKEEHALADIGSGGGVPGIPLAIARPDAAVTLIEATKKKAAFLRECAAALELANVTVIDSRAEEAGQTDLRESFDIVTARAVGELVWLIEWCIPLARKGGRVLAMKGQKITEELPAAEWALKKLNAGEPVVRPADLPGTEHHVIVEITKLGRTDPRYPRPATVAKGRPL